MANDARGINRKIKALPALATDVRGMHGQMAIMAAGMDSTMGKAGRMMSWGW